MAKIVKIPPDDIMNWYRFEVPAQFITVQHQSKYASFQTREVPIVPREIEDFIADEATPGRALLWPFQAHGRKVLMFPVAFDDLRAATMFKLRFL